MKEEGENGTTRKAKKKGFKEYRREKGERKKESNGS